MKKNFYDASSRKKIIDTWSLVYTYHVYSAAAKRRDFSLNAMIFRFCVHFIMLPLSLSGVACAVEELFALPTLGF